MTIGDAPRKSSHDTLHFHHAINYKHRVFRWRYSFFQQYIWHSLYTTLEGRNSWMWRCWKITAFMEEVTVDYCTDLLCGAGPVQQRYSNRSYQIL